LASERVLRGRFLLQTLRKGRSIIPVECMKDYEISEVDGERMKDAKGTKNPEMSVLPPRPCSNVLLFQEQREPPYSFICLFHIFTSFTLCISLINYLPFLVILPPPVDAVPKKQYSHHKSQVSTR